MARPTLLSKPGRPVPEWNIAPAELEALLEAKAPRPAVIKTRKLRINKELLRVLPATFVARDLVLPERWWGWYFCRPRYRTRKNQKNLTEIEWQRFIHAIEALAESGMPSPTYADFVQIHIEAMDTPQG